jgi:hypothetical protein
MLVDIIVLLGIGVVYSIVTFIEEILPESAGMPVDGWSSHWLTGSSAHLSR